MFGRFVCILRPFRFFGYSFKLFKKLKNKACLNRFIVEFPNLSRAFINALNVL